MSNSKESSIPRRDVLRGAMGVVGASVLGVPAAAFGQGIGTSKKPVSVAFWDGIVLVSADKLSSGDVSLENVRISLSGHGAVSSIQAIDAMMPVQGASPIAFHAWTAPPAGGSRSTFMSPVDSKGMVTLSVQLSSKVSVAARLSVGKDAAFKLREGIYVLAAGDVNWGQFNFTPNAAEPLVPHLPVATPQYVVIRVSRA